MPREDAGMAAMDRSTRMRLVLHQLIRWIRAVPFGRMPDEERYRLPDRERARANLYHHHDQPR
jgi:hypothetical protein